MIIAVQVPGTDWSCLGNVKRPDFLDYWHDDEDANDKEQSGHACVTLTSDLLLRQR